MVCTPASAQKLLEAFGQNGGDPRAAQDLLRQLDIDPSSVKDDDGMSILHLACQWDWLSWHIVIRELAEKYNCDVSAQNNDKETPLHIAARCNNGHAAQYLLNKSCDASIQNSSGLTALEIAHEKHHDAVLQVLIDQEKVVDCE